MAERQTFIIHTFTMASDLNEDRIRLHAVDPAGQFQAIFLTRRLADRFVPVLAERAEKAVSGPIPGDLVLSIEQERLRMERDSNPQPPVEAVPDALPWLCTTIHMSDNPQGGVQIDFTDERSIDAYLGLDEQSLRAMLDVFLITYRNLGWSEDAFPDWVRSRGEAQPVQRGALN
ncbi:hypothetical protein [Novosphingobium sp. TH158]|uniref:hypothetical protein n=1 Tax=Novosphingobium sp. TH158 TaxID=2067455 RepID=UPI000C7AF03A|nr:hypothetical protein [Novosphingobium sp. TH158]PLK26289.1 hypothetical protein C0V78_04855 [Novosphingobium sp. TH158]